MAQMPEIVVNVLTVQGARLTLSEGDTLAVMVPDRISMETSERMKEALQRALPSGVRVMIFDGGVTVAAIKFEDQG